jgi:hypothetical protein
MDAAAYLRDLRHLTTLLLHLARQSGAELLADWAASLLATTGTRRWGIRPPDDPGNRAHALATADEILAAPDLDTAVTIFIPWVALTPTTPDGPLGWLADRTVMTPTLTRLVMAARAPHRRLSHHLDTQEHPIVVDTRGIPQVIPAPLYTEHLAGASSASETTVRLFASLCLARIHPDVTSWAKAAEALAMPAAMGVTCARACSATLLVDNTDWARRLDAVWEGLRDERSPTGRWNYRNYEAKIAHRRLLHRWFDEWVKECRPATRPESRGHALTWQWVHLAHGHLHTSPAWRGRPGASERAHYRKFETSLDQEQQRELRSGSPPGVEASGTLGWSQPWVVAHRPLLRPVAPHQEDRPCQHAPSASATPRLAGRLEVSPLPLPVGKQLDVIHLDANRHNVVLGTAGTGKTTMAIHRAVHLAHPATPNHGPVLLVTFNNALVSYLRYLSPPGADITMETYGLFARGYLNARGQMPSYNGIAQKDRLRSLVGEGLRTVRVKYPSSAVLGRDVSWFQDELSWIAGMGLDTEEKYQHARRIGRQTPLGVGEPRSQVWSVLEAYLEARTASGARYDWTDIASAVRTELAQDEAPRRYRHVVIDEGQDLSPEALRSLTEATQPGGSVTFFGDYHQAIYGQGLSWRSAGLKLGSRPVERFVDNYRNTAAIAKLAIALSQTPAMATEDEDLVIPKAPVAAGPPPTMATTKDAAHEVQLVQNQAAEFAKDQSVAILARTWALAESAAGTLKHRKLDGDRVRHWDPAPGIWVGPYHSAKGLEFDAVIMPFLDDARLPWPDVAAAFVPDEAAAREARLLYVALTRARSQLLMTHSGRLTTLLPFSGAGLWTEVDLT